MTEKKIISLGKISQFISEIFRYAIIVILLAGAGIGAVGIGVIICVVFFRFIQQIIPFRISINREFLGLTRQTMSLRIFKKKFVKKLIYNIILLMIISFAVSIIMDEWFTFNKEDKVFLSVITGALLVLLLFQFYYFYIVFNYVKSNKLSFSQDSFIADDNIIEKSESASKPFRFINTRNNGKWLNSLTHNEIIIISVIMGVAVFLIFGYSFSERVINYRPNGRYNYVNEFNYILGFTSLIITFGISYLFLNSRTKNR